MSSSKSAPKTTIVWFRKCLRLHDNAALVEASATSQYVIPLFVLDPAYCVPERVGAPRMQFLLEALRDLDERLRTRYASRLFVARGEATSMMKDILHRGSTLHGIKVDTILWEADPVEPYALRRDAIVAEAASAAGVEARAVPGGHTLWDLTVAIEACGEKVPTTMPAMEALAVKLGRPASPLPPPSVLQPPPPALSSIKGPSFDAPMPEAPPDSVTYEPADGVQGGETAGLQRLARVLGKEEGRWAAVFEKPSTKSTSISTTLMSPYLKFGCVSARKFYHDLQPVLKKHSKHSKPPTSLVGQLYFREMAYLQALKVGPNFDKQTGSPVCLQVPWRDDYHAYLEAWTQGKTGFPFIDACMRQLANTGWMHHLARHACACFLTRGDLWVGWEHGAAVFERQLLDADWAVNTFNWLGLAGVAPWSPPYFRVYAPSPDPKKSSLNLQDPDGNFIRKYIPELRNFPARHIYSPWNCPIADQRKANCIIGKDYPKPIVDHAAVSKTNLASFKKALDDRKQTRVEAKKSRGNGEECKGAEPPAKKSRARKAKKPTKT